jgi:hypothetical protein
MMRVTADVAQALRQALSESSIQDPDLAKVVEEKRISKVAHKNANGESADSFSWGSVSRKGSQRLAESDSETIDRSYFALLQKISKLEAEKGDLQMQVEL